MSDRVSVAALDRFGRTLLRYIREEATKDAARSPDLPRASEFLDSFRYRVDAIGGLTVTSTWAWTSALVTGSEPYRMTWLTRARGVGTVPLRTKDGDIVFRAAPLTADRAWIHPGIARHNFIQRAYDRAVQDVLLPEIRAAAAEILRGSFG